MGIRSWIGCINSFPSVVMMQHVSILSPAPLLQASHIPAIAKGSPDLSEMNHGYFLPPSVFHSKNPVAGMMQRRVLKAVLKEGFSATVSPRALASLLPINGSFAQLGMRPHFISLRCR